MRSIDEQLGSNNHHGKLFFTDHMETTKEPPISLDFLKRDEFKSATEKEKTLFANEFLHTLRSTQSILKDIHIIYPKRGNKLNHHAKLMANTLMLLVAFWKGGTEEMSQLLGRWQSLISDADRKNGDQRDMLSSRENLPYRAVEEKMQVAQVQNYLQQGVGLWKQLYKNFESDSPFFFKLVWKDILKWIQNQPEIVANTSIAASSSPPFSVATSDRLRRSDSSGASSVSPPSLGTLSKSSSSSNIVFSLLPPSNNPPQVVHTTPSQNSWIRSSHDHQVSSQHLAFVSGIDSSHVEHARMNYLQPQLQQQQSQWHHQQVQHALMESPSLVGISCYVHKVVQQSKIVLSGFFSETDSIDILQRGLELEKSGLLEQAQPLYDKAVEMLTATASMQNLQLRCCALMCRASTLMHRHLFKEAFVAASNAVSTARKLPTGQGATCHELLFSLNLAMRAGLHLADFATVDILFRELVALTVGLKSGDVFDQFAASVTSCNKATYLALQALSRGALDQFRTTIELQTSLLGKRHIELAITISALGDALFAMEVFGAAFSLWDRALQALPQSLADVHPLTTQLHWKRAKAACEMKDFNAAATLVRKAVELANGRLRSGHPIALHAGLTRLLIGTLSGSEVASVEQIQGLLSRLQSHYQTDGVTFDTLFAMFDTASFFALKGKLSQATQLLEQAQSAAMQRLAPYHPLVLGIKTRLALMNEQLGQHQPALSKLDAVLCDVESWASRNNSLENENPASPSSSSMNSLYVESKLRLYLGCLAPLARLCFALGLHDRGTNATQQMIGFVNQLREIQGQDPFHADTLHCLGLCEFYQGNLVQSLQHFDRAHSLQSGQVTSPAEVCGSAIKSYHGAFDMSEKDTQRIIDREQPLLSQLLPKSHAFVDTVNQTFTSKANFEQALQEIHAKFQSTLSLPDQKEEQVILCLERIASAYYVRGDLKRARNYFAFLLVCEFVLLNVESPRAVFALHMLGDLFLRLHDFARAKNAILHAIKILEQRSGQDQCTLAALYSNLGSLYICLDDRAQANKFLEQALQLKKAVFSKDHPSILVTRHEIARLHHRQGELQQALSEFQQILPLKQAVLGKGSPETLATEFQIASILAESGDFAQARTCFENIKSACGSSQALGTLSSSASFGIAVCLASHGESQEALGILLQVLAEKQNLTEGLRNPEVACVQLEIGNLYLNCGQPQLAVAVLKSSLETLTAAFDSMHSCLAPVHLGLGHAYGAQIHSDPDLFETALHHLRQALSIHEASMNQHAALIVREAIGDLYVEGGRMDEAVEMYHDIVKKLGLLPASTPDLEFALRSIKRKADTIAPSKRMPFEEKRRRIFE